MSKLPYKLQLQVSSKGLFNSDVDLGISRKPSVPLSTIVELFPKATWNSALMDDQLNMHKDKLLALDFELRREALPKYDLKDVGILNYSRPTKIIKIVPNSLFSRRWPGALVLAQMLEKKSEFMQFRPTVSSNKDAFPELVKVFTTLLN